ncbi:tropinone reductase like [Capsicum galapagoense]
MSSSNAPSLNPSGIPVRERAQDQGAQHYQLVPYNKNDHLRLNQVYDEALEFISLISPNRGNLSRTDLNIRSKLRRLGSPQVIHCYGEQNGVADAMAKLGSQLDIQTTTNLFKVPPVCAQQAQWEGGTFFVRSIKLGNDCNTIPGRGNGHFFALNPD